MDGDLRKKTPMPERVRSYRRMYLFEKDKIDNERGYKTVWKKKQLERFFTEKVASKLATEDPLFQLAFLSQPVFEKVDKSFDMHKAGELLGQKIVKRKKDDEVSARTKAMKYTNAKELAITGLMVIPGTFTCYFCKIEQ